MKKTTTRSVEILVGIALCALTGYIVTYSPMSLRNIYARPIPGTTVINPVTGTHYRPALDVGPIMPLLIVFFCMLTPIYSLCFRRRVPFTKGTDRFTESTFLLLRMVFIFYGLGVFLLFWMTR